MGAVMSADVHQNLIRLCQRRPESRRRKTRPPSSPRADRRWSSRWPALAHEAEAVLAEEPPASVKVYFAADFDEPGTRAAGFRPAGRLHEKIRRRARWRTTSSASTIPWSYWPRGSRPPTLRRTSTACPLLTDVFPRSASKTGAHPALGLCQPGKRGARLLSRPWRLPGRLRPAPAPLVRWTPRMRPAGRLPWSMPPPAR
ncbi:MAG: hypothetical protein MZV70_43970 [Desulfobacterales bacterium]|nr:hypothetical protein [Desulfobacterales bacterium]